MNSFAFAISMLLCSVVFAGCNDSDQATADRPQTEEEYQAWKADRENEIAEIASTIKHSETYSTALDEATGFDVLIGLPHPTWEPDKLAAEKRNNDTIDDQFYTDIFPVAQADVATLKALFGNGKIFTPFRGWKLCGGYHADYRIICRKANSTGYFDICFGCHEIKAVLKGKPFMHVDIADGHHEPLKAFLAQYRR